jgi:endonuclease-8
VPEGDTVFLAGRRLHDAFAGKELVRGELRHPELATIDLAGCRVREVATVGKHLLTRLDDGRTLHSHLRLDGAWHLYRPGERWRGGPMHAVRAILQAAERVAVGYRLHDLELVPTEQEHRLVGHLGPDLLDASWGPELAADAAARLAARPERELGLALLDQTVMAGVGNLYRAEICFLLGVSPWAPVSAVDAAAAVDLARTLLARNAWRPQQSTTGELRRGAQNWVYSRTGRPCLRCGSGVRSGRLGDPRRPEQDRTVYFCPSCQPMPPPVPRPNRGSDMASGAGPGAASGPPSGSIPGSIPGSITGSITDPVNGSGSGPRAGTNRRSPRSSG